MKTMANYMHLGLELPAPPPHSDCQLFYLFSELERMLARWNSIYSEEVIARTEAYFEAIGQSYQKNGNRIWLLKANMLNNKIKFLQKKIIFLNKTKFF